MKTVFLNIFLNM